MTKIEKKNWLQFDFSFLKKLIRNLKKKRSVTGRATLPLWFEPNHNYVCPAVTEWINEPVGLIRAGFSATGLFLGRKSKISRWQNVSIFQFYIRIPNFRPLGSIIKKKYLKVVDPLKGTDSAKTAKFFRMRFFFFFFFGKDILLSLLFNLVCKKQPLYANEKYVY